MSKKSYDLPNIQRPEDVELYLKSFNLGRTRQAEIDRAAAFGAIRRAVQVARDEDYWAKYYAEHGETTSSAMSEASAESVRDAIRAAIGSERA